MNLQLGRLTATGVFQRCSQFLSADLGSCKASRAHLLFSRLSTSSEQQMQHASCTAARQGLQRSITPAAHSASAAAPHLTFTAPQSRTTVAWRRQLLAPVIGLGSAALHSRAESGSAARPLPLRWAPAAPHAWPPHHSAPLRALSSSWPQQPDDRREYTTQTPWWQVWAQPGDSENSSGPLRPPEPLPEGSPSAAHEREMRAVNVAVVVNAVIFVAKMVTYAITGSGALLAEGLHSAADCANQLLLKQGVIRSRRKPTRQHQYGFHKEKYVYALISAACVFCVGCGASVLHGVSSLLAPHPLENMSLSLAVLLGSSVLETYSLRVAFHSIQRNAEEHGMGLWQYIKRGRDPTTVAILWEDGGAVAGLGLAGAFTLLTYLTGQPHWDALGSIAVGLLMGAIALQLMRTNKRFLIGQAMEPAVERRIVEHLQNDRMVVRVIDPKSEEMGDGVFRFKAEIQWSGEHVVQKYLAALGRDSLYKHIRRAACTLDVDRQTMEDAIDLAMMDFGKGVIRTVGSEIDRLEGELKELVPGLVYVDLETDKGSAGGVNMLGSVDWGPEMAGMDLAAVRRLYETASGTQSVTVGVTSSSDEPDGGSVISGSSPSKT